MEHPPPLTALKDEDVVTRTLADRESFGVLIERYETKLRRYITRLGVRSSDDQDDVLQETFIKTYKNLNSFNTSLSFSSWVYRIAHNEAMSWFRRRSVRPEGYLVADSEEVLGLVAAKQEGQEVVFDTTVNAVEVAAALEKLDEKYREVLVLRFFEHKEYDEISDILKIPIGSVGTLIHRGKKQLYNVLNHHAVRI